MKKVFALLVTLFIAALSLTQLPASALVTAATSHAPTSPDRLSKAAHSKAPVTAATSHASTCTTITIPGHDIFSPKAVAITVGGCVTFRNGDTEVHFVRTTPHNPAQFSMVLKGTRAAPPHGQSVTWKFTQAGLYHFYCSIHASVTGFAQGNDIVTAHRTSSGFPFNPMQMYVVVMPTAKVMNASITVSHGADLFIPKAVAIDLGGRVTFHNFDTDPHLPKTTPHAPAQFMKFLLGTAGAPKTQGQGVTWQFTKPGVYHFYCTIHSAIAGFEQTQGDEFIKALPSASGFQTQNPMETYVIVVQRSV